MCLLIWHHQELNPTSLGPLWTEALSKIECRRRFKIVKAEVVNVIPWPRE